MANPITLLQPAPTSFSDGQFVGANGSGGGNTPAGSFQGYQSISPRNFWNIPAITPATAEGRPAELSPNKLIVYINGINTTRAVHPFTVKLASVVSGRMRSEFTIKAVMEKAQICFSTWCSVWALKPACTRVSALPF